MNTRPHPGPIDVELRLRCLCLQPQRGEIFIVMESQSPKLHRSRHPLGRAVPWKKLSFRAGKKCVNRFRFKLLAIKELSKEFLKSDIEMDMPPRWGFSSFGVGGYNYVAPTELKNGSSATARTAALIQCQWGHGNGAISYRIKIAAMSIPLKSTSN